MTCPDLTSRFPYMHVSPRSYSYGIPVASDWSDKPDNDPVFRDYKQCGSWTAEEKAILFAVVKQVPGKWLEIGAATGMTTAYLCAAGAYVTAIEPMFSLPEFYERFATNTSLDLALGRVMPWAGRSDEYFKIWDGGGGRTFDGIVIDGDHNAPYPLDDAMQSADRLNERGAILLHDAHGDPMRLAIRMLIQRGFHCKMYATSHCVGLCWRGDLKVPEHKPVPEAFVDLKHRLAELSEYL